MKPLCGQALVVLQEEMRHVQYILIDDMSLIGPRLFIQIDSHMREVFLENKDCEGLSFWL